MITREMWEDRFEDSDSTKQYFELCSRDTNETKYFEKHHILPKSMWPEFEKSKWNLVRLSLNDHFTAHKLLSKMCLAGEDTRKMTHALWFMTHRKDTREAISEEEYINIRKEYIDNSMGDNHPSLGRKLSQETKDKIGAKAKGRKASPETCAKISKAVRQRPPASEQERLNRSKAHKGKKFSESHRQNLTIARLNQSDETKNKIRLKALGRKASDETRLKMSEDRSGENNTRYGAILSDETKMRIAVESSTYEYHQYDTDMNLVKVWSCAYEIKLDGRYSVHSVRAVCYGKQPKYKGFIWKAVAKNKIPSIGSRAWKELLEAGKIEENEEGKYEWVEV